MATVDMQTKFREDRSGGSRDIFADRQTDTQTQTDGLITILRTVTGHGVNIVANLYDIRTVTETIASVFSVNFDVCHRLHNNGYVVTSAVPVM